MYDRMTHLCLTKHEACEIGCRAMKYLGAHQGDVAVFAAVFQVLEKSFQKKLKDDAATKESLSGCNEKASEGSRAASLS